LADGLMLVFQHPAEPEGGVTFLMEVFERMNQTEALAWIADLFEMPPEKIQPDTKREAIPAWDSLGVLTLMAALDEKFDTLLTEEEMQTMQSVQDILNVLNKNGKIG
jgi:acyl carrier protein